MTGLTPSRLSCAFLPGSDGVASSATAREAYGDSGRPRTDRAALWTGCPACARHPAERVAQGPAADHDKHAHARTAAPTGGKGREVFAAGRLASEQVLQRSSALRCWEVTPSLPLPSRSSTVRIHACSASTGRRAVPASKTACTIVREAKQKKRSPNVGLEPTTTRLRVWCSAD